MADGSPEPAGSPSPVPPGASGPTEPGAGEPPGPVGGETPSVDGKKPQPKATGAGKTNSRQRAENKPARGAPFAPRDPNDGRDTGDWLSTYRGWRPICGIILEATYLGSFLVAIPLVVHRVYTSPTGSPPPEPAGGLLTGQQLVANCTLAWLGGMLGGTLFSTKWLYHSVAKRLWHEDRRLWRMFTPLLSGGLAFATYVIVASGLLPVIDRKAIETPAMAMALGFIVGYFSDSATAKLAELAETLFGSNRK